MKRQCEVVKECSSPSAFYVMDVCAGGWAMRSCASHVDVARGMFPAAIVYDERKDTA
jgi:hypothetical protein